MPTRSRRRDRRVAVLLGGAAMVGAATTMAVAAQTALPGESLYGVKRGLESAEVRFAGDDAARGRTLLAQADTRLSELERIAAGDAPEQLIPDTLDTFTRQSGDGVRSLLASYDTTGSTADVQVARDFTAASMDRLEELQGQLPESARDDLLAAGRTLTDLDIEASNACATCGGGITTVPEFLLSSAPTNDLLSGLDSDSLTLEAAAPVSGQDLTGIEVPEVLQSPTTLPTTKPTDALPTQVPSVTPDPTKVKPDVPGKVKDTVDTTVDTVTDTTSDVVTQLDGVTGGALGGLTGTVDNATGGLISEVTGTLDGLTGNTVTDATGGLLP